MGLFDSVEKQKPLLVLREDLFESPGFAGFIPHEQLRAVQVQEFRHIETKEGVAP